MIEQDDPVYVRIENPADVRKAMLEIDKATYKDTSV